MRGNLPLAPRRFPPPPLMGRKSAHEPLRVVSRSRERDRRVRAADDRGRGRADALRAREAALLATLRDRGRSPVRRPAHRDVRLAPRAHLVRRLVLALLTDSAGRSRRLDVPAAVDRARRRRGRAAARPAITNRYRKRMSYRFWRRAHYLNFAIWGLALSHGIAAGTDRAAPWALALYIGAAATVTGLIAWRTSGGLRPPAPTPSNGLPPAQGDP